MLLAGKEYDAVPWIHNGYLYVLVKVGVLGLLSYLAFFAKMFVGRLPGRRPLGPAIVRGTVGGLLLSNIVVCGWFNIESVFAFVVLGYMFAVRVTAPRPDGSGKLAEPALRRRNADVNPEKVDAHLRPGPVAGSSSAPTQSPLTSGRSTGWRGTSSRG